MWVVGAVAADRQAGGRQSLSASRAGPQPSPRASLKTAPLCDPLPTHLPTTPPLPNSLLGSESNVVHSYAAIAVDRLLAMREPSAAGGGGPGPRFQPAELVGVLQPLLEKLFGAFKFPESGGLVGAWFGGLGIGVGGICWGLYELGLGTTKFPWLGGFAAVLGYCSVLLCPVPSRRACMLGGCLLPVFPSPFHTTTTATRAGENEYVMRAVMRVIAFVGTYSVGGGSV